MPEPSVLAALVSALKRGAVEVPAFPCHSYLTGSDRYGLTQLQNLARLPAHGAVVIAGPLPIVTGSGAPARVLALVERA